MKKLVSFLATSALVFTVANTSFAQSVNAPAPVPESTPMAPSSPPDTSLAPFDASSSAHPNHAGKMHKSHLDKAIAALEHAKKNIKHAKENLGDHRAAAISHIDAALQELEAAEQANGPQ